MSRWSQRARGRSSTSPRSPDSGTIDCGAAKAALLNLAKSLWLGEHGVAATVAKAIGTDKATAREGVVANLVAFLASPRSANVTGANYVIDGGLIKTT